MPVFGNQHKDFFMFATENPFSGVFFALGVFNHFQTSLYLAELIIPIGKKFLLFL